MKIETKDFIAEYNETEELKTAVFEKVLDYFKEHEAFCGESILQMDNPVIEAPHVMADIADNVIKFKYECKDT